MYKRISAAEALCHPWFCKLNPHSMSSANLEKLEDYYVRGLFTQRGNNLISVIEAYLCLRKVTQEERQKLACAFTSIDRDGDGLIEREELVVALRRQQSKRAGEGEGEVDGLVESIDKDRSGKIDFNEFIIAMYDKH
jgi:calcium-dependent protein kinase